MAMGARPDQRVEWVIDPAPALRRYETVRAKQLRRIVAMTRRESSTTYGPLLMHAVPDRVAPALYARLIEESSSVLA